MAWNFEHIKVEALFVLEYLGSITSALNVVLSNYGIHPFTEEASWSHHQFYINMLYRKKTDPAEKDAEEV